VLFIYTGATKLFDVQTTAQLIASKVIIPSLLEPYTLQLETMVNMKMPQVLALVVGSFEIIAGLMIAANFGARFFAILLILFVIAATYYVHDFWNPATPDRDKAIVDALKNLSIIGALFIIAGYGRGSRNNEPTYDV